MQVPTTPPSSIWNFLGLLWDRLCYFPVMNLTLFIIELAKQGLDTNQCNDLHKYSWIGSWVGHHITGVPFKQ